jgi:hypothetical protein
MRLIVIVMLAGSALSQQVASQAPQPAPAAPAPAAQAPADAPGGIPAAQRVGSMSELMIDIIYPASDAIFYVTTRQPTNDVEWNTLRGQALMVAESANLLMMPGRARDQDRWMADARLLLEAGTAAFRAARRKDLKALEDLNDQLYQSCTTCHMHYRPNYGRRPAPEPQTPR